MRGWMLPIAALGLATAALRGEDCASERIETFAHAEIGPVEIHRHRASGALLFVSIMHVNPDGAPDAYHPDDIGTVHLCNGMSVGGTCAGGASWKAQCMADYRAARAAGFTPSTPICFFAMARRDGVPVVQGEDDPRPGYFVSTTALAQPGADRMRPSGYVDSNTVPFAVIPSTWPRAPRFGVGLGDFGYAFRAGSDHASPLVVADLGPARKLGEGSIALLQALGHDPFVMRYGTRRAASAIGRREVLYVLFPGSADGAAVSPMHVAARADALLAAHGGREAFAPCLARLRQASAPSP
ncbi:glycoside hydrolase family 75 protein [Coralloluteibacterium stylophorae]|uniref:Chitosanase (Glycosyl hydrolase group 75) n=1 Tax=Coralloluteibacterium stylophorae TaxID=1776034 RepID=A0A8J8AW97_9GAMM|nr:glycoside hydrolase family 75 protein [Coralloluteibacterium stylophorae]MBS7456928.1 hypothetical protein [Coralloluteibacterium stylophorae]